MNSLDQELCLEKAGGRTFSMAYLTLSEVMSPFLTRLVMRPALLRADDVHAMVFYFLGKVRC